MFRRGLVAEELPFGDQVTADARSWRELEFGAMAGGWFPDVLALTVQPFETR